MGNSNLLQTFLSMLLTLEEIGVPVVVYMIYKYFEEEKLKHEVSSMYYKVTWFMVSILILSAIETTFIVIYLVGWLLVDYDLFIQVVTLFFLIPVMTLPFSLLLLWIRELK